MNQRQIKKKPSLETQVKSGEIASLGPKLRKFSFKEKVPVDWEFGPMALHGNFHLLVGPSGSGKTKTLNVLANLKHSVVTQQFFGFLEDNRYSWKLSLSHVIHGKDAQIDYQFSIIFKENFVSQDPSQNIQVIEEVVSLDGKEILTRHQNTVSLAGEPKKERWIPLIPYSFKITFGNEEIDTVLQCLSDFFNGIRRLNANSHASIDIEIGSPSMCVEPGGRGLSSSLEWMQQEYGDIYQRIIQEFQEIYQNVVTIDFKTPDTIQISLPVIHLSEKGGNSDYSIVEAAGGIQRVLSILNLIYAPGPRSLICIDEMDSSLDALRIDKLLAHIYENRETLPQILAVSHNPYFQDRCPFSEWIVTKRHGNKVEYYLVDEDKLDPLYQTGLYGNSRLFKDSLYDEPQLPLKSRY